MTMRSHVRILLVALVVLLTGVASAHALQSPLTPIQQMFILKKMKPDIKRVGIIWAKNSPNHDALMPQIKRAAASANVKLFVAYPKNMQEVAPNFRELASTHKIQALWIVEEDQVVNNSVARNFLIKNATKSGIPILAPSKDWVTAGASVTMHRQNGEVQIIVNKAAAAATALTIPDKYKGKTSYL